MERSDAVTQWQSVLAQLEPNPATPSTLPDRRHRWWAVPMAVLGLGLGGAILVSSAVFVDRYADAPGSADDVNQRMGFSDVPRYDPEGEILFVTVSGPHVTALQGIIGWADPDIRFDTYKERFGDSTPEVERTRGLVSMRNAKNDAPYAALTKLGYPTELIPGAIVVDFVYCREVAEDGKSCDVMFPADDFFETGDEILSIDGTEITTAEMISDVLATKQPGDSVDVVVRRLTAASSESSTDATDPTDPTAPAVASGEEVSGAVVLSPDPDDATRPIFGIRLADTAEVKLPFTVDIDTGKIGGPSAGLAFSLTLIDELTPGELTGGQRLAVTGTIDVNGNVGAIGGLHQKAAAVKREGANGFIVPADQSPEELADIRRILGDDRVFPVATLDEALDVLARLGGNADELGTPGADFTPVD